MLGECVEAVARAGKGLGGELRAVTLRVAALAMMRVPVSWVLMGPMGQLVMVLSEIIVLGKERRSDSVQFESRNKSGRCVRTFLTCTSALGTQRMPVRRFLSHLVGGSVAKGAHHGPKTGCGTSL